MLDILPTFWLGLAVNVAIFVATLIFSTKIKDWFRGIPSDLRKGLNSIETAAITQVRTAQTQVVSSLTPPPAPVVKPPVT